MSEGMQALVVATTGGIFAVWLSHAIRLPAIILLLAFGIGMGPDGLWSLLGFFRPLIPRPDRCLPIAELVGLGVAVILFEGGLQLNVRDLRLAPRAVRNLITTGAVISMAGSTLCARLFLGMPWSGAVLFGALMIVTGPTVIVPLLRNIRVTRRVHTVLLWEGILIDAIGAIVAVASLEIVLNTAGFFHAGTNFIFALLTGPVIGAAFGWPLGGWLKRRVLNESGDREITHLLALGGALFVYGISESVVRESGLGAVIVAGMVVGNRMGARAEEIRQFKGTLTTLLIAVLFMLLAANFRLNLLKPLWPAGFVVIAMLMFVVRPATVFISTLGTTLNWRERLFISWIGPRGIVAASVASLFGLILKDAGLPEIGDTLVALTFSTILVTVLVNGLTAYPLAWALGIQATREHGLLVVGANDFAVLLGEVLNKRGCPVILVDTNRERCEKARKRNLHVVQDDALNIDALAEHDLSGIGGLVALTANAQVNVRACARTAVSLGLSARYAPVSRTPDETERWLLRKAGVQPVFAQQVEMIRLINLVSEGRAKVKSVNVSAEGRLPGGDAVLPLIVVDRAGIRPCVAGEAFRPNAEVVVLEFAEGVALPFAPVQRMKDEGVPSTASPSSP